MKSLEMSKVLVIDDTEFNIDVIVGTLEDLYDVRVAMSGKDALQLVEIDPPDIILLDIAMPQMDGFEVCRRIKTIPIAKDIPIIFVSANNHLESKMKAFELGGVDYIVKPFDIKEIQIRVKTQLELKYSKEILSNENHNLDKLVRIKTNELLLMRSAIIQTLATLAELRDDSTGHHILRTQHYVHILADYMLSHKIYSDVLTIESAENIILASPLHDIGKIGIEDAILLKPGKLTESEFDIMKQHTILGRNSMEVARRTTDFNHFFEVAKEITYSHHERWDGSGYPQGLSGNAIPVSARIIAIADVYDALISKRVYKKPIEHSVAITMIIKEFGSHFDPLLADAFLHSIDAFHLIASKYSESDD